MAQRRLRGRTRSRHRLVSLLLPSSLGFHGGSYSSQARGGIQVEPFHSSSRETTKVHDKVASFPLSLPRLRIERLRLRLRRSSLHQQCYSHLSRSSVDQSTEQPTKVLSGTCDRGTKVYLSVQIQLCSMSGLAESEISKCPRLVAEPVEGRCDGH